MNPETKGSQIRGALIALALTVIMLPILGLWAVASGIYKMLSKSIDSIKEKGTGRHGK